MEAFRKQYGQRGLSLLVRDYIGRPADDPIKPQLADEIYAALIALERALAE